MNNNTRKIAMLVRGVFYPDGSNLIFGGVERYTIDLCKLLKKLGYEIDVFQGASSIWTQEYQGIRFYGLIDGGWHYNTAPALNQRFHERIENNYDFVIYNGCNLNYPKSKPNSLSIHHGIWWDCVNTIGLGWVTDRSVSHVSAEFYRHMEFCLNNIDKIVSVDTNAINWTRAVFPHINNNKFEYIPNYVDLDKFKNLEEKKKKSLKSKKNEDKNIKEDKKFTVLFPRRLEEARGWHITLELAKRLSVKYPDIHFSFVGRQAPQREEMMKKITNIYPNIHYKWLDMADMPQVYQEADIVILPSIWSEGTSLSCLEAMACGKPVIAGLVGGLTDLIINDFNGILIQAGKEGTLENAILDLYNNSKKREMLSQNGLQVVKRFSKDRWEQQWIKVIKEIF